jgi:ferredoxin
MILRFCVLKRRYEISQGCSSDTDFEAGCGDCLSACDENAISYRFLKLSPKSARTAFLVAVVSLHAVFLAVAMI